MSVSHLRLYCGPVKYPDSLLRTVMYILNSKINMVFVLHTHALQRMPVRDGVDHIRGLFGK
jgi:hypothetical protein